MKRLLCLLMALLMVFALAACSEPDDDNKKKKKDKDKDSDISVSEKVDDEETEDTDDITVNSDATIDELLIYDENKVKIYAKNISYEDYSSNINLLIENNYDKDLTVNVEGIAINGCMINSYLGAEVAAGKKVNDCIEIYDSDLAFIGIDTIATIEIVFSAYTSDDYEEYFVAEAIVLETSEAESYNQTVDTSGDVAYDKDGVKIIIQGTVEDEYEGKGIKIYVENGTNKFINVQSEDVSVNGFMLDPYFSTNITASNYSVTGMFFSEDELEENGIDKFEEIELSFTIIDYDSWDKIAETSTITIEF